MSLADMADVFVCVSFACACVLQPLPTIRVCSSAEPRGRCRWLLCKTVRWLTTLFSARTSGLTPSKPCLRLRTLPAGALCGCYWCVVLCEGKFSRATVLGSPSETLLSPECVMRGTFTHSPFYTMQLGVAVMPFLLAILVTLTLLWVTWMYKRHCKGRRCCGRRSNAVDSPMSTPTSTRSPRAHYNLTSKELLAVAMVVLFYTLHPFLTKRTLQMFHCRAFTSEMFDPATHSYYNDTRLLLTEDLRVSCTSTGALAWMTLLGVPMVVVFMFGIPVVLFVVLHRNVGQPRVVSQSAKHTLSFLYATCTSDSRLGCHVADVVAEFVH